jgi:uncharacterized membrane protein YbhN (UPF0104 family)
VLGQAVNFSRLKSYLPYLLSIAALFALFAYLYRNAERYQQLLDLSAGSLFRLFSLVLMFTLANGLINYLFYHGLGLPLTLNEGIGLAAVNTLANQLPFAGGMIAKGVYLKQRYKLTYTRFLSATLALYVCFVATNGVVGVAVLAYLALVDDTMVPTLLILGFSAMAASVLLLWLPVDASSVPDKWGQRLAQLVDGWQVLSQNRLLVGELVGVQILIILMFAGRFWIAFHALSQDVTLAQCILFSAATILTRLVSIAPGGFGVREAVVAGVASVLGFDVGVSVVAVGIDRLVATVVIIALGTVYAYILSKKVANAQSESEPYEQ